MHRSSEQVRTPPEAPTDTIDTSRAWGLGLREAEIVTVGTSEVAHLAGA